MQRPEGRGACSGHPASEPASQLGESPALIGIAHVPELKLKIPDSPFLSLPCRRGLGAPSGLCRSDVLTQILNQKLMLRGSSRDTKTLPINGWQPRWQCQSRPVSRGSGGDRRCYVHGDFMTLSPDQSYSVIFKPCSL